MTLNPQNGGKGGSPLLYVPKMTEEGDPHGFKSPKWQKKETHMALNPQNGGKGGPPWL